jgi:hypothetical protein
MVGAANDHWMITLRHQALQLSVRLMHERTGGIVQLQTRRFSPRPRAIRSAMRRDHNRRRLNMLWLVFKVHSASAQLP